MPTEVPYEYIRERLEQGRVIPFLGAGASLGHRPQGAEWNRDSDFVPTADELAAYLRHLSGFPSDESAELTRVAQFFDGVTGRGGLEEELHAVFSKPYEPDRLHRYLAGLDHVFVVTTNYDNLMERAFEERDRAFYRVIYKSGEPEVIVWRPGAKEPERAAPNDLDLPLNEEPVLFKMHGTPNSGEEELDSFVITEDDYVEFLARMTSKTAIPAPFAKPFRKCHFLFLGYGLRDWNLRVILYRIWKLGPSRRKYASWAIQYEADPLEREFWSQRMLHIFDITIGAFLDGLDGNGK